MDSFIINVLFAFWIFLPAGAANMSPVLANRIPGLRRWDTPINKRLLGSNKRWRGLVVGTLVGSLVAVAEFALFSRFIFSAQTALVVAAGGALMGFGALVGDAVESFFKRRVGVKPGHSWFPFDQIDYIIGGLLFSYPLIRWPLDLALTIFVLYFGLHLAVSYLGYLLGLKDKPI
jgi:CDP-2,3-bis-(O-geranylgeranyl)-sn-glycerol synthase